MMVQFAGNSDRTQGAIAEGLEPELIFAKHINPRSLFEADRYQLLRLCGEFHGQVLQHVLDEAVDEGPQPPLH